MRIVSKPIGMIATFVPGEEPKPFKFNYNGKEIIVDSIIDVRKTKIAGIDAIVYHCSSIAGDKKIRYELKYTIATCQWTLYKI